MNDLKELIGVISKHKIKNIEVIGNTKDDLDSKFERLYNLIANDQIRTEEEAIRHLYGAAHKHAETFNRLKNRLKIRLIDTLFFIDVNQPQFSDIERAFHTCNKNWIAVRILLTRGARNPAIKLAQKTFRVASKFELTELRILLSKELRLHYSLVESNSKKYDFYDEQVKLGVYTLQAELKAEEYFGLIMKEYTQSQSTKSSLIETAQKFSTSIKSEYPDINTIRFIRLSYQIHILRHQIAFQFQEAIDECYVAITIVKEKPFKSNSTLFDINLRLLSCFVQTKDFGQGQLIAQDLSSLVPVGSYNWLASQFYFFLLSSHSKQYQACYDITQEVINLRKFKSFYPNQKQLWLVIDAFVQFLINVNKIDLSIRSKKQTTKFKLYKFLNNIPVYSKDKRGINISILIVHVLFLLEQKQYDKIIDRVDALNQYCHRYLRKDDTLRANCFIKMLIQMPRADFNRFRTERYAKRYYDNLRSAPLNIVNQGVETELIPYEHLWDIVLDLLGSE